MDRSAVPLWPLPLAVAVLLFVAAHLAWVLSVQAGYIPYCLPYWDGCTSISRAARQGAGNHLFRLLILPCALLQGLHWWSTRRWLRLAPRDDGGGRSLLPLGVIAASALAVYATFLGTDGDVYRVLRRYGVVIYFGSSYLAQLVFLRQIRRRGLAPGGLSGTLLAICVLMLALGLANTVAKAVLGNTDLQDRLENALEWQLGLLQAAWFVAQAWLWRRSGYALALRVNS